MRNMLKPGLITFISLSVLFAVGQENCKVLKPEIAGTYDGKCKNGLAHGKGIAVGTDRYEGIFNKGLPQGYGIYTWSTGEKYTGEWIEGMRHGIGKFTSKSEGKDSILNGLWQKDMYIGPKPQNPSVLYNSGVDRYNFRKSNTTKNRVLIDITQNGTRNLGISNFMISASSGSDANLGQSIGYDFVTFPVTIKIAYTTWNKLHTMPYNVKFDFEIFEPGDWKVELQN
jgi:hypothetical protein